MPQKQQRFMKEFEEEAVRRSRPVPGWPDPHCDGPSGRLAP